LCFPPSGNALGMVESSSCEKPVSPAIVDVRAAAQAIGAFIERTPARYSQTLSKIAGCDLFFKFQYFQFTVSFKECAALLPLSLEVCAHIPANAEGFGGVPAPRSIHSYLTSLLDKMPRWPLNARGISNSTKSMQ
jgi:hypothetical protein